MTDCKVLIIEDDEVARGQIARIVQKEGFAALTAKDGREGLSLIALEKPEIVCTDLNLPHADGLEVLSRVKRTLPRSQVIIISACSREETVLTALHNGALDFLYKPLNVDLLILALGRAKEKITEERNIVCQHVLLLAEEEPGERERLAEILKKEGYPVLAVDNGRRAIELFQKIKIDVALLDSRMSGMDGRAALEKMRALSRDFEAIIFYDAEDEEEAVSAMQRGAFCLSKKPVEVKPLLILVQKALEKLTTARALQYRTRDLELARVMIAGVSQSGIVVDLVNYKRVCSQEFAEQLLNAIPMGLLVLEEDYRILFINRHITNLMGYTPTKLDEAFMGFLPRMGISEISLEKLKVVLDKIFHAPRVSLENIKTGQYSYISCLPLTLLMENKKQTAVLLALRGERK